MSRARCFVSAHSMNPSQAYLGSIDRMRHSLTAAVLRAQYRHHSLLQTITSAATVKFLPAPR
jgi:hypothetical protein